MGFTMGLMLNRFGLVLQLRVWSCLRSFPLGAAQLM